MGDRPNWLQRLLQFCWVAILEGQPTNPNTKGRSFPRGGNNQKLCRYSMAMNIRRSHYCPTKPDQLRVSFVTHAITPRNDMTTTEPKKGCHYTNSSNHRDSMGQQHHDVHPSLGIVVNSWRCSYDCVSILVAVHPCHRRCELV